MANHPPADAFLENGRDDSVENVSEAAVASSETAKVLAVGPSVEPAGASSKVSRFLRKRPKAVAVWAAILLGGGAIAYFNYSQNAPRSLSPAGTQLVPQTALATMTVTTDELTWTKLRQFGNADSQEQFNQLLGEWGDRLFTVNGYNFRRDIKPWVGDRVTLAFLPDRPDRSAEDSIDGGLAAATQNLVLVVPIADPLKAKELLDARLDARAAGADTGLESRTYKGVRVNALDDKSWETLEFAVIGTDWLLLSNTPEGIEQAIDTHKGKRSLLDNAGYRKAATRVVSPQPRGKNLAQFYLNIPAATEAMAPPQGTTNRPRGSLLPLQGSQGIVATALIESDGIRFQGTSWLSPKNDLAYGELENKAGEMPRRLPSDTLVAMSGSNLQQFWQGFSEGKTSPPFFPDAQSLKAGLLTQTGLDIDEDIMPWAAGEFAMGVLPPVVPDADDDAASEGDDAAASSSPDSVPETSPEASTAIASAPLLMMVQTNDRPTAESVWSQIDDVMVTRYRYQVETTEVNGGSITEWISPFQGVQFSHGWLPGDVAFFAVGDGAAEAIFQQQGDVLAPSPSQPLSSTRLFQTLTSGAPTPNNGHFYLNLDEVNAQGSVFPLPQLPTEGPTSAIRAIGLTSTVRDRTMDYDLYVQLVKPN
ncbi:MAG: DUF3352 domain-containing protein [Cyanobacteria bacterium P01_D01_bin.36]